MAKFARKALGYFLLSLPYILFVALVGYHYEISWQKVFWFILDGVGWVCCILGVIYLCIYLSNLGEKLIKE